MEAFIIVSLIVAALVMLAVGIYPLIIISVLGIMFVVILLIVALIDETFFRPKRDRKRLLEIEAETREREECRRLDPDMYSFFYEDDDVTSYNCYKLR